MIGRIFKSATIPLIMTALSCGRSGSEVQNTFGEDNRERVTSRDYPFSGLGKLNDACTGVLIGKRLMLTAAHCVFDSTVQRPRDNFTRFDLGLLNGQVAESASPVRAWIGSAQPEDVRSKDWAIVELDKDLGESNKFMTLESVDFEKTLPFAVNLAGYSSDINAGLTATVHWGCSVHKVLEGRLFHDCDSTAGISGGPLFASVGGDWRIVGVSVSEFRNGIEPPVKREKWAEEYTNVALPVKSFGNVASSLMATVDKGTKAPDINDAILIDFKGYIPASEPNSKPHPQSQPQPQLEQKPAQSPGSTPPQIPSRPAEPLQNPSPQFSPEMVFAKTQMVAPWILWERIVKIQDVHRALVVDASVMSAAASVIGDSYLIAITNHFSWKLSENIHAWNAFVQCMSTHSPCIFDVEILYNTYVAMKYAEIDLGQSISKASQAVQSNLRAQQNIANSHLRDFEVSVFSP